MYKIPALTIELRAGGASGEQRSRNLRGVGAALCQLSYTGLGLVGRHGFEPWSRVYQTRALPIELSSGKHGGLERICTSTAARRFYRALGSLMPSQPENWCCSRDSNPDHLRGRQARLSITPEQQEWSR